MEGHLPPLHPLSYGLWTRQCANKIVAICPVQTLRVFASPRGTPCKRRNPAKTDTRLIQWCASCGPRPFPKWPADPLVPSDSNEHQPHAKLQ